MDIAQLLAFAVGNQASDLHLSAGVPPMVRIHGDMRRIGVEPLASREVHDMLHHVMSETQRKDFATRLETDFSFAIDGLARFRANAYLTRRGMAAAFRTIPSRVPTLDDLQAPATFGALALKPRGLILVTGPTGSGKSTTLAAMVGHRNACDPGHILTIEDPIEFVHEPAKSLVSQRELGPHTHSFANALRSALREDPDAILIGELRDPETIRLALTAAETGHLVLATLHTSSAASTVDRIVDVFPSGEKNMARTMLSESLVAVISQALLKTRGGGARVAAYEVLIATPAIRHLIRDNRIAQICSLMQAGGGLGMQTLDQCLLALLRRNLVDGNEARALARSPDALML